MKQKHDGNGGQERRLASKLWAAFEADPLEDGMDHPAEKIIEKVLQSEDKGILDCLRKLCLNVSEPSFAASVMRCLRRQNLPGTNSWRTELVRDGLVTKDVEIRDAAVQAAESWGSREILDVPKSHQEPERWIRDYIRDVVEDLRENLLKIIPEVLELNDTVAVKKTARISARLGPDLRNIRTRKAVLLRRGRKRRGARR